MALRTIIKKFQSLLPLNSHLITRSISVSAFLSKTQGNLTKFEDLQHAREADRKIKYAEGLEGEMFYHFKGGQTMDAVMPTIETLSQEFDGTPYNELPVISIKCSKTNTRIFIYDFLWNLRLSTSSKVEGFKNCKKKSTVAGQATGVAAGLKALRRGFKTVRVVVRGIGPGRATAVRGLTLAGMNVVSISDFTPIPEKGPRGRKQRFV